MSLLLRCTSPCTFGSRFPRRGNSRACALAIKRARERERENEKKRVRGGGDGRDSELEMEIHSAAVNMYFQWGPTYEYAY